MRKPKVPHLVTVAITTTITIVFWIFFSLYSILTTKPDIDVDPKILEPLTPNLDTDTLDSLKERVFFEEQDVTNSGFNFQQITITPTTIPEEAPEEISITPTPEIPEASEGG